MSYIDFRNCEFNIKILGAVLHDPLLFYVTPQSLYVSVYGFLNKTCCAVALNEVNCTLN